MPRPPALPFLLALLAPPLSSGVLSGAAQEPAPPEATEAGRRVAELLARDARASFLPQAGFLAEELLDEGPESADRRAAALMTLGAVGGGAARTRLQAVASEGVGPDTQVALLALGELGPRSVPFLLERLDAAEPALAECLGLALLRTGSPEGRRAVETLAETGADPELAAAFADLLRLDTEPGKLERVPRAFEQLMEARWAAARRFGLVDGRSWSVIVLEELCRDDAFLDLTVLPLAARESMPGIKDHLLELLTTRGGPSAVEAAVIAMPDELESLILSGIWRSTRPAEWEAMLAAIDEQHREKETFGSMTLALQVPEVEDQALTMLLRLGHQEADERFLDRLSDRRVERRIWGARAMGASRDTSWLGELGRMRVDPDPRVRAAALVAQARLDEGHAVTDLRAIVADVDDADRPLIVAELCKVARDGRARLWLEEGYELSEGEELLDAATALALQGRLGPRELLREALSEGRAKERAVDMIRALARGADSRDLVVFRELFPVEGDRAVNVELARALISNSDSEGLEVVRAALWRRPWQRSVLAAALLSSSRGLQGLVDELAAPPRGATHRAIRRVGFALGELGGIEQVESLARRRTSADPAVQGALLGALSTRTH